MRGNRLISATIVRNVSVYSSRICLQPLLHMALVLTFRVGQLSWQHHSLIGGFSWRWSYTLLGDLLRLSALILLAVADPEVIGPLLLVLRLSSFIMAVPAGRSVVFVTGNAKKLEEVKSQTFHTRER